MDIQNSIEAVKAAVEAGDIDRAMPLAAEAIKQGAQDPLVYNVAAHGLQLSRRYAEAMDLLIRASRLAPNDPYIIIGIGQVHSQQGQVLSAERAFRHALSMDDSLFAAHHGLGLALEFKGDVEGARRHFEEAVRLAPDFAEPWGSLALQALQRKEPDVARSLADRALEADPVQSAASVVLTTLDFEAGDLSSAEARARGVLARGGLAPLHESSLWRLLGDILDAAGRPLEAFEAYDRGNKLFRRTYAPQVEAVGVGQGVDFVERLRADFAARRALDWTAPAVRPAPGEPAGHVFMTGFFRSGTTLLEQILASHPAIETMEEVPILDDLAWAFFKTPEDLDRLAALDADKASALRLEYWRRVRSRGVDPGAGLFVDKLPMASLWTPFIGKVFPEAKILWVRRDPRDVVLSCFRHRFQPGVLRSELADLERGARLYDAMMSLFESYLAAIPLPTHVLRHEDLVADFDREVQAMCDFLGVEWREEMRDFPQTARRRTIRTPSAKQVVRELNAEGVARWRAYASALAPVREVLAPWVERFGYPAD